MLWKNRTLVLLLLLTAINTSHFCLTELRLYSYSKLRQIHKKTEPLGKQLTFLIENQQCQSFTRKKSMQWSMLQHTEKRCSHHNHQPHNHSKDVDTWQRLRQHAETDPRSELVRVVWAWDKVEQCCKWVWRCTRQTSLLCAYQSVSTASQQLSTTVHLVAVKIS